MTHNQVARISNQSGSTESRAITLRSAPSTSERCKVDLEFGLGKASGAKAAAGIVDSLQVGLSTDVLLDEGFQRLVASNELVDKCLEREGRVTSPGVKVWKEVRNGSYEKI